VIRRVFIDTDILLDVALAREPFVKSSRLVMGLVENNIVAGCVSSNEISNIYYILRKTGGDSLARKFISKIVGYITVIPIDHSAVIAGLESEFADFEDSLQHRSALRNQCDCIVTRNVQDYARSEIAVHSPAEICGMFRETLEQR